MKAAPVLIALVTLELVLLGIEAALVRGLGQQAIAAALLAAPASEAALLGLGAVLARIGAHALVPAAIALAAGVAATRWVTARRAFARRAGASR